MIAAVVALSVLLVFMVAFNVWILVNTPDPEPPRWDTRPVVGYYLQAVTRPKLNQRYRFKDRVNDGVQHTQAATREDASMQKTIEKEALAVGQMVLEQYRLGKDEILVYVISRYAA